jgi:FkbM family methyltransferase
MYHAEFETDKFIRETFFPNLDYKGIMIEVGAGPTTFYSMSKHFRDSGWRCICIDPNPKFVESHKKLGNEIHQVACSNFEGTNNFKIVSTGWGSENDGISYSALEIKYDMPNHPYEEITVNVTKLDTLLDTLSVENVDFVSIDVEGWELEVMEGFSTSKYKPKVILLENYTHRNDYEPYMNNLGYVLNHKLNYNYIFEKK